MIFPEVAESGLGFATETPTVPTCAVVVIPVAVTCVEEFSVVVRAVVPRYTFAPGAKCLPVSVRENAPTGMETGNTAFSNGVGLPSVAPVFPDLVLSAVSTALIVMVFGVGGNSGAV